MFVVEYVTDLRWETPDRQYFSCFVKYAQFGEPLPACIFGNDVEAHTRLIWANAHEGVYGPIQEYVEPEPPPVENQAPGQTPTVEGAQVL